MTGRILIADASATNRIALRAILQAARYDVLIAETAADAFRIARRSRPTATILDADLIENQTLTLFSADPETRDIPLILVSNAEDVATRLDALKAGVDEIMNRPIHPRLLLARIRGAVRARETAAALAERQDTVRDLGFAETPAQFGAPPNVALIALSKSTGEDWTKTLSSEMAGSQMTTYVGRDFGGGEPDPSVDLFLVEADPQQPSDALGLLADLRSGASTRHASVLVIHAPGDPDTAAMALDVGANDVVDARIDPREFALRIASQVRNKQRGDALRASVEEGLRMAMVDPLTGLFNRRYAMTHANRLIREHPPGRALGVIVADIDRFKGVNDTWGHAAGDSVLREVAWRLQENVRDKDTVSRIGGEEFLILLPDATTDAVPAAAHRLCALVREEPIALPDGRPPITVTISLGVAFASPNEAIETVIDRADKALYDAKAAGRDTVTVSGAAAA